MLAARKRPHPFPGFGAKVRHGRQALGLTQQDLADRCGSTQAQITAWERDRRFPTDRKLYPLCAALGIEPPEIVRDAQGRKTERCSCKICAKSFIRSKGAAGLYCSFSCSCKAPRKKLQPKPCKQCGETFQPAMRTVEFCGIECRAEARRNPNRPKNCLGCGGPMPPRVGLQRKYCSNSCVHKGRPRPVEARGPHKHWPEGSKREHIDGYVEVKTNGKWIQEHRIVMAQHLGRPLHKHEKVHHKNRKRADNRLENLEVWLRGHPPGERLDDLLNFVVEFYPEEVRRLLDR